MFFSSGIESKASNSGLEFYLNYAEPATSDTQGYISVLLQHSNGAFAVATWFWNTYATINGVVSPVYADVTITDTYLSIRPAGFNVAGVSAYFNVVQIGTTGNFSQDWVSSSSAFEFYLSNYDWTVRGWKGAGNIGNIYSPISSLQDFTVYFSEDGTAKILQQQLEVLMGLQGSDAQVQQKIDETNDYLEEQNQLQEEGNKLQEEANQIAEEQKENEKNFFDNFFGNLIDAIIGVFVPSSEELSELFDRLNTFFSDTFGFLYYPFDFIIRAFDVFLNSDSDTGITFPGFSIMGYEVWDDYTYNIADEGIAGDIFGYVRIGTGAMLGMFLVGYLRNFFDKRFGGGGN